MLDRRFVVEHADQVRKNIANRQMDVPFDRFLELEEERKVLQQQVEEQRAQMNELTKKSGLSVEERREQGQVLKKSLKDLEERLAPLASEAESIFMRIPNLTDDASPVGEEADSETIGYGAAEKQEFDFTAQDHIQLMENAGMLNLEAAAKVSGSGFYYLVGDGALLELAMMRFALDHVMKSGFTPVLTPDLARDKLMEGTGFVPRGNESNTYHLEDMDLNLIATSEITLIGMFADEILDASNFPLKVVGQSHCFRSERAHGSATRGIYRVHQFSKTEMVVVCLPEQAEEIHMEMRKLEQEIFDALGIPYRVLEIATGDLGAAAYRKFDLEAWMPGRQGGSWGEVTSTSNCTDFQARRLKIRYRDEDGKPKYAATLNGTAISICRAMIALVENHQQADGSIKIPEVLQPYMNGKTEIKPLKEKGQAA
ncbi:MAG: serine--tRNA ligase [Alphaproteobacteria bacterium]|nr:serine--tRNA ligase [Alphaproteobacteria bacterium]MDD9920173.1 serine--tRNA ligase [Alphaproteobacteria bacterium]